MPSRTRTLRPRSGALPFIFPFLPPKLYPLFDILSSVFDRSIADSPEARTPTFQPPMSQSPDRNAELPSQFVRGVPLLLDKGHGHVRRRRAHLRLSSTPPRGQAIRALPAEALGTALGSFPCPSVVVCGTCFGLLQILPQILFQNNQPTS